MRPDAMSRLMEFLAVMPAIPKRASAADRVPYTRRSATIAASSASLVNVMLASKDNSAGSTGQASFLDKCMVQHPQAEAMRHLPLRS